jgi:hypothetical protein
VTQVRHRGRKGREYHFGLHKRKRKALGAASALAFWELVLYRNLGRFKGLEF